MEENKELSITITSTYVLTLQMIEDLMVAAFEGGINYWCRKVLITKEPSDIDCSKMLASEVLANGGEIILFDAESSDKWKLTREMVVKGIKMYCEKNKLTPEAMYDDHDADTADAIVQYAIFDEITFG